MFDFDALRSHWTSLAVHALDKPARWFESAGCPGAASVWCRAVSPAHDWLVGRQLRWVVIRMPKLGPGWKP
jgi:hypothetical protein